MHQQSPHDGYFIVSFDRAFNDVATAIFKSMNNEIVDIQFAFKLS
jgi:hypothetical protein